MSEIIAGVEVPDTAAVAEAARHVQETTSPLIYHHSRRVYFFGQIHAHRLGIKPDPELLYLAAMFHDTGLTTSFSDAEQRFEVDGADHGRKFLLERGFSATSATYLWRVYAAREIMRLYREDPEELGRIADLQTQKATQEEVFHPEDETEVFEDPGAVEDARSSGELVALPDDPALGFKVVENQLGEQAPELDATPETYRALRPEALATLIYLSSQVKEASGETEPLKVTSAVRDLSYQDLLVGSNPEATSEYSLHTTGWSFDILRKYGSDAQGEAFQFALDRLKALNVIDYAYEPAAIHVTVGPDAAPLVD